MELESLILDSRLNIANRDLNELDFTPPNTSFIDVTLAGDKVKFARWFYPSIPSFSDHPYIYFEILINPAQILPTCNPPVRRVPHLSKINVPLLNERITSQISALYLPSKPTIFDIEESITELSTLIADTARKSKGVRTLPRGKGSMPWRSKKLCALRTEARRSYKLWARHKTEENKSKYRVSKAEYQREMRRAKDQSWNDLNKAESSSKDMFAALNFLSGKAAGISLPPEILIDDMSVSNPMQILNQCSNHFFQRRVSLSLFIKILNRKWNILIMIHAFLKAAGYRLGAVVCGEQS